MAATDTKFAGSIPTFYDDHLVPLIFQDYANDMARRIARLTPAALLEIAAGTGVVARALAPLLPTDGIYVATDLNPAMLAVAQARQGADARLSWREANAQALPFEDARFDAACCQFGAMFFPDRVGAFGEVRRVLRPGGTFVFSVWDRIEDNVFADVVTEALSALYPQDPPRFLARTPHGHFDAHRIRQDLAAAGFHDVSVEMRSVMSRADKAEHVAIAYCHGTPLRGEIEAKGADELAPATQTATDALTARFGPGPIEGKIQALVISAVR